MKNKIFAFVLLCLYVPCSGQILISGTQATIQPGTIANFNSNTSSSLTIQNGAYVSNNGQITLLDSVSLNELSNSGIYGNGIISATRNISAIAQFQNIAGLGISINTNQLCNSIVVKRGHIAQTGNGNTGIKRYFDVNTSTGISGTVEFLYKDSMECNGITESLLEMHTSTDTGTVWSKNTGTLDTVSNKFISDTILIVTKRYTLANKNQPLPVKLIQYVIECSDNMPSLVWSTSQQINHSHFVLQYSTNGQVWIDNETVYGQPNSIMVNNYRLPITEQKADEYSYVRLKQVDINGYNEIFPVLAISKCDETKTIVVYPNPVISHIHVNVVDADLKYEIANMYRQVALSGNMLQGINSISVNCLIPGTYFLKIYNSYYQKNTKLIKH